MDDRGRWRKGLTVGLLTGMLVVHNAQRFGVVPLFDALRERFGTDYAGVGTLFAAYVLGYAIFQTVIGLVGDRVAPRRLLLIGLGLSALWSALFAVTTSYSLALVTRFLLGATSALLYTPAMTLGITLFPREERGRVLGTVQTGAGIGMGGALVAVPLVASRAGIAGGFLMLPVVALVLLGLAAAFLPAAQQQERRPRPAGSVAMVRRPDFWGLLLTNFTGMLAGYGLLTWLPTFLTHEYGRSEVEAGSLSALFNVAMLISAPVIGALADLRGGRIGVIVGGSVLTVACYLALVPQQPLVVVLIISALVGVAMSATTAPMMLFGGERFGPQDTARVVGLFSSAAQIGAALSGAVFGYLLERSGNFTIIWVSCAVLAVIRLALFGGVVLRDWSRAAATPANPTPASPR